MQISILHASTLQVFFSDIFLTHFHAFYLICKISQKINQKSVGQNVLTIFLPLKSHISRFFHTQNFSKIFGYNHIYRDFLHTKISKKYLFLTYFLHSGVLTLLSILGGKVCQKYRQWATGM